MILYLFSFFFFISYSSINALIIHSGIKYSEAFMGYLTTGEVVSFGDILFEEPVTLKDFYLPSRLAESGYITVPGGGFGATPETNYLSALANTELDWSASTQTVKTFFETGYYKIFDSQDKRLPQLVYAGFSLSLIKNRQSLILDSKNCKIAVNGASFEMMESTAKQFFLDAGIDFTDFFQRYVLKYKNLKYIRDNELIGLGDLQSVCMADWGGKIKGIETLQAALILGIPLGKRQSYDIIWPNHLGEGAFFLQLQGSMLWASPKKFFNPYLQGNIRWYLPFKENRRVKKKVTALPDGALPERFSLKTILPFEEYDSKIHFFADKKEMITIYEGMEVTCLLGNFIKIKKNRGKVGFLYEGKYKEETKYASLNTPHIKETYTKKSIAHHCMFHIDYIFSKDLECSLGISQQVAGYLSKREFNCTFNLLYRL